MNLFTPLNYLNPTETQELLYVYTGAPPMAYGSRTRAVLENISRPYEYYIPNISEEQIPKVLTAYKRVERVQMESPSSGFVIEWVLGLAKEFSEKYSFAFTRLKTWLDKNLLFIPYSELSNGRQTWSFILKKNIPAPNALEETVHFLELNLKRKLGRT